MGQKGLDYNIIHQLQELESKIDLAFKKNQEDEADLNSLLTLEDEQTYWNNKYNQDQSARSKFFQDRFQNLFKLFLEINNQDLIQLQNTIEHAFQILNDVWGYSGSDQGDSGKVDSSSSNMKFNKSQLAQQQTQIALDRKQYLAVRMKRVLRIVNELVINRLRGEVDEKQLWNLKNHYRLSLQEVKRCLEVLEKTLGRQGWRHDSRWDTGVDEDYLIRFTRFHSCFDWLLQLRLQLELMQEFNLNLQDLTKYLVSQRVGVNSTQKDMAQVETKVNEYFQAMRQQVVDNIKTKIFTQQSIARINHDYKKYQVVIQLVKKDIQQERQELLRKLRTQVDLIEEEFNHKNRVVMEEEEEGQEVAASRNMSKNVMKIVWSRQLSSKVKLVGQQAKQMLSDLEEYPELEQSIRRVLENAEYLEQEQFDNWEQEVQSLLHSPDHPLQPELNTQLLEMVGGELVVYFSERLVLLLRETRQMMDMEPPGRKVSRAIIQIVENSKKYYKNAIKLKQIANFYNNMSQQIVESQQRMLVQEAMEFEDVINRWKKQSNRNIEEYVEQVCSSYNKIIEESSKLRRVHEKLVDQTIRLLEIDVVSSNKQYRQRVEGIKKIVEQVVQSRDSRLCKGWQQHWEQQVAKVEQVQFRKGILSLLDRMDRVQVQLVSHRTSAHCRPSIGQAKHLMYVQVTQYIQQFAMQMDHQDSQYVEVVYSQIENIFKALDTQVHQLEKQYNVIQWLEPAEVVAQMLERGVSVEGWKAQIQVVKQKRREVQNLDDSMKVGQGIELKLNKYREQVDEEMRDWLEQMTKHLNLSIKQETEEVEQYVNQALQYYDQHRDLQSIQELDVFRKVKEENEVLQHKRQVVQQRMESSEDKHEVLRYLGGVDTVGSLKQVQARWDNLQTVQHKYEQDLTDYQANFKNTLEDRGTKLETQCQQFYNKWTLNRPKKNQNLDKESVKDYSAKIKAWNQEWEEIQHKMDQVNRECVDLGLPTREFQKVQEINQELVEEQKVWGQLDGFQQELEALEQMKWMDLRSNLSKYQELYSHYEEEVRLKLKEDHKDTVTMYIYDRVDEMKGLYSALKLMVGEQFQQEHWRTLLILLEVDIMNVEDLTLHHILDKHSLVTNKIQDLKELALRAQGEVSLREAVLELKIWLETAVFDLVEHMTTDQVQIVIIKEWKDLLTKVGDQQALLGSLRDSKYASRFVDQLEQFDKKLGPMDDLLRRLNQIQRKWVYLEPIFGKGALPSQQSRFQRLDSEYRSLMLNIHRDSRVASLVTQPGINSQLDDILEALESCQKALNDFLEEKRNKFARFYFLGDDDLLEILGQSQNVNIVQLHLKKLFTGIDKVQFVNGMDSISHIISSQQEKVQLKQEVIVKNVDIEDWLQQLTDEMKRSLGIIQSECVQEKELQIQKYPSQILQITENVRFNQQAIEAIKQQNLANFKVDLQGQLDNMTKSSGGSKGLVQLKLKALIMDLIHNIDVVSQLLAKEVKQVDDWQWFKQIKYQQKSSGETLEVTMCKAKFSYSYEYQGNPVKLVHTPLTDKCYLTLTQGMHMGFGGCPYGPAGTGKTESVKALGQLMGRQVLVFNCDEGIDFKAMGRIFIGLVRTGSWGCFDEFNRLLEEQLSAISQQIQVIQQAIKERQSHLQLLGKTVNVNKEAAIFVTMNPAGKGYGGRSKLPDNLKQLFRPVAMTTPNNELIAEVLLFGEGFTNAQLLAKKIVSLFILSSQLLSKQQHYDWGLRALKTCLNVAGGLIQQARMAGGGYEEAELLIKSIRINTLSKLTHGDANRFKRLLDDVFPGVIKSDVKYIELEEAIDQVLQEMGYQLVAKQKEKILQFNEAIRQRTGAVLVGPSGCGKSTLWKVLKKAMEKLKQQVNVQILNPKALPKTQLLGCLNQDTREFTSGVLTAAARQAAREPVDVMCWVICDGDVDPEWIEALNSVLDDNRLLTLPTGERISFGNNVNFIFETNDLQYASPATISRMGMILLSEQDLPVTSIIQKWQDQQPPETQSIVQEYLFEQMLSLHNWMCEQSPEHLLPVQTTQLGRLQSVLIQLD